MLSKTFNCNFASVWFYCYNFLKWKFSWELPVGLKESEKSVLGIDNRFPLAVALATHLALIQNPIRLYIQHLELKQYLRQSRCICSSMRVKTSTGSIS